MGRLVYPGTGDLKLWARQHGQGESFANVAYVCEHTT